nr:restriction endonuclease subunit S [uncultured Sphingomonas sp.]
MTWPTVPLGEVLRTSTDRIALSPDISYKQVTAKLWGKGLTLRGEVAGAEIAASHQNRVREGQFVISKIDARHGAFGVVPSDLDGAVVSNDFPVFDVQTDRALTDYVAWVSRTDWFVALCKRASEGSTNRVRLKEARFLAQSIPLPPLTTQRRIVARLDSVAAAVAARAERAAAVEAEVAATLSAAFACITADAPRAPMGEVAPLVRRPVTIDLDASYPELGVRSFGRGTFHKPALDGVEVGSKKLFCIEADDLLFNIVFAWEGAIAVARPEDTGRVGSHRFLTCVPLPDKGTPAFLRYWFLTPEGLLALGRASPGGAGRNRTLGIKALEAIQVPVPPLNTQRWFDTLQAKAQAARKAQAEATAELAALLPAMLNDAFGANASA